MICSEIKLYIFVLFWSMEWQYSDDAYIKKRVLLL